MKNIWSRGVWCMVLLEANHKPLLLAVLILKGHTQYMFSLHKLDFQQNHIYALLHKRGLYCPESNRGRKILNLLP